MLLGARELKVVERFPHSIWRWDMINDHMRNFENDADAIYEVFNIIQGSSVLSCCHGHDF